jgi:hypothetical protein
VFLAVSEVGVDLTRGHGAPYAFTTVNSLYGATAAAAAAPAPASGVVLVKEHIGLFQALGLQHAQVRSVLLMDRRQ